jgi:hypothetical protein
MFWSLCNFRDYLLGNLKIIYLVVTGVSVIFCFFELLYGVSSGGNFLGEDIAEF